MNKFGIVLGHTYFTRLKSKAFIITTAIALVFIFLVSNIQTIIEFFITDDVEQIAVIDESDQLLSTLEVSLEEILEDVEFIAYEGDETAGKEAVQEEEYEGLLILRMDEDNIPAAVYYTNEAVESNNERMILQQLQQIKTTITYEQAGIDTDLLATINEPVQFEKIALDESAKTEEELFQAQGIVYVMLFVLYMSVMIYGQMIAMDVATEKSSRVMEILISSASPVTHMFAKILGVALLGLTQIILFLGVGYFLFTSKLESEAGELLEMVGLADAPISVYLYALLFFILGYFLYATIAAMLGSLVSRVEDVSQLLLPMTFLIMIAFFIAIFGLATPDATFITVTSFIPFFTPMIMFLRVGMLDVPFWQVGLSIGLLIATIIALGWLGARIYRGGVLMYGPSKSLKDFKKAFQLTKKEK